MAGFRRDLVPAATHKGDTDTRQPDPNLSHSRSHGINRALTRRESPQLRAQRPATSAKTHDQLDGLDVLADNRDDERILQMTDTQLQKPQHPAFLAVAEQRSAELQLRIADKITAFAGSMKFVYLHAALFAVWMLVFERSPWPTLTLIVSLEAIFLSTFVMIGQNRQAAYQQAKADHDFAAGELELHTNTELTRIVHQLTTEIHARLIPTADGDPATGGDPAGGLTT